MEFCHCLIGVSRGAYESFVTFAELLHFATCVGVGLGDPDAGNAALDGGVDGSIALPAIIKGLLHCLAVVGTDHDHDRHTGKDDKGQQGVDAEEISEGKDDHYRADENVFRAVVRQFADFKQVAGDPGHDPSGFVVIIETERELLQVIKKVDPHLGLHFYANEVTVVLDEVPQKHADHIQHKNGKTCDDDGGVHPVGDEVFQHLPGDNGIHHTDHGDQQGGQHVQRQHFGMWLVVTDKAFEHVGRSSLSDPWAYYANYTIGNIFAQ